MRKVKIEGELFDFKPSKKQIKDVEKRIDDWIIQQIVEKAKAKK